MARHSPGVDYGIDAPRYVALSLVIGIVAATASSWLLTREPSGPLSGLGIGAACIGAYFLLSAGHFVWSSKVGKLRARDRMLDALGLQGDETVLDVGCGRGLMLTGAARRLDGGMVVGIDVWNEGDQTGSSASSALRNAELEGVRNRVEVKEADARSIPFPDDHFDVVLSSLVIHNIKGKQERGRALREMMRVTKPGGRMAILDIWHGREYERLISSDSDWMVKRRTLFLFLQPAYFILAIRRQA